MTITATYANYIPRDDTGELVEPNPHFDAWDPTPHAYFTAPVTSVTLADIVLGGTHQVEGIGRSEQRGSDARRLDLNYVAGHSAQGTARLIVPIDQLIEVKRYLPTPGHRFAYTALRPSLMIDADGQTRSVPEHVGLVPDYGSDTRRCGCDDHLDTNDDGYDVGQTMCDACAGSWASDYIVVRG